MKSRGTLEFWQLYRTLPPEIQRATRKAHAIFLENPAARRTALGTSKIRSARAWSVRITRDYRAVAVRSGDDWLWVWIGTHKEFDRKFPL